MKKIRTYSKNGALVAEKRDHVAEMAARLFARKGYDGTTTLELARACGMSKGALYHYFGTKEDILYQVIASGIARRNKVLADLADIVNETRDPVEALRRAIDVYFHWRAKERDMNAVLGVDIRDLPKKSLEQLQVDWRLPHNLFREVVLKGVASGVFHVNDAEVAAMSISSWGRLWERRADHLKSRLTIDEYVRLQTENALMLLGAADAARGTVGIASEPAAQGKREASHEMQPVR